MAFEDLNKDGATAEERALYNTLVAWKDATEDSAVAAWAEVQTAAVNLVKSGQATAEDVLETVQSVYKNTRGRSVPENWDVFKTSVTDAVTSAADAAKDAPGQIQSFFTGADGDVANGMSGEDIGRVGAGAAAFIAGHQFIRLFAGKDTGWFSLNGLLAFVVGFGAAVLAHGKGYDAAAEQWDKLFNGDKKDPATDFASLTGEELETKFMEQEADHKKALLNEGLTTDQVASLITGADDSVTQATLLTLLDARQRRAEVFGKLPLYTQTAMIEHMHNADPTVTKGLFEDLSAEKKKAIIDAMPTGELKSKLSSYDLSLVEPAAETNFDVAGLDGIGRDFNGATVTSVTRVL